jgi:hypothetical protein
MSPLATTFAFLGGAIFLTLFVWKSRDFFKEAWNDAKANQFPPKKCLYVALAQTTLRWLVLVGSFVVFGATAVKADSLLAGLGVMAIWVIVLIAIIIKITRTMPIKAEDLEKKPPA